MYNTYAMISSPSKPTFSTYIYDEHHNAMIQTGEIRISESIQSAPQLKLTPYTGSAPYTI
jgi:hypothetical protein